METRSMDSPQNELDVEAAIGLCQQLWQQGGLVAAKADLLFETIPALKPLLQPIANGAKINAYCLTVPLLTAFKELSHLGEWQLALLGLNSAVRSHWLNLAAARCREAGAMSDPQVLVKLIQQLGNASEWVLIQLENPTVTPQLITGPQAQFERDLLGYSLNDNAAIPTLCRILRASFNLHSFSEQADIQSQSLIQTIDLTGKQLGANWCAGRLLALPATLLNEQPPSVKPNIDWLLVQRPSHSEATFNELFSQQPWLFLLSLITFVQDAWAAEQRGGLLLTLPTGQNAFAPSQINVAVQGIEGDEVSLGSLAEFILRLLGELNIALYPALDSSASDINRLDRALSPLVAELLTKKIWQFSETGRSEPGHYRIHSEFSDACYRLPLAPLFGYKSTQLQQAIKQLALSASAAKKINLQGSAL